MTTTTQNPKRVRPDESPFDTPALTSGYPLDDAEKTAIAKVLGKHRTDVAETPTLDQTTDRNE